MRFLLRLLATAAALWVAVLLLEDIRYTGSWPGMLVVALIFGLVNAVIRPILKILTCPLVVLTLGLFVFVLNALMLWLASEISQAFGIGFYVEGFWTALVGALIVSLVSTVLNLFVGRTERPREARP